MRSSYSLRDINLLGRRARRIIVLISMLRLFRWANCYRWNSLIRVIVASRLTYVYCIITNLIFLIYAICSRWTLLHLDYSRLIHFCSTQNIVISLSNFEANIFKIRKVCLIHILSSKTWISQSILFSRWTYWCHWVLLIDRSDIWLFALNHARCRTYW
jgi:hypothetical protein